MPNPLVRWISRKIPPNTPLSVCPPGEIATAESGMPLVVVASFPRSGTHLLIDLILNNFPAYRRRPLYVNLDEYLKEGRDVELLLKVGGYILKTHYPEGNFSAPDREGYERIFQNAVILHTMRPEAEIVRSFARMLKSEDQQALVEDLRRHDAYWKPVSGSPFAFEELVNPACTDAILAMLEERIPAQRSPKTVGPPSRSRFLGIYFRKIATRLFGNRLSQVNTTVGFNKS